MKSTAIVQKMLKEVEDAIAAFNSSVPDIQRQAYEEILHALKDLKLSGGKIANVPENIRLVNRVIKAFEKFMDSPEYHNRIAEFSKAFDVVSTLQNQYFSSIISDFKPIPVLREIRNASIDMTVNSLTEAGVSSALSDPIRRMLMTSITSGGKFSDLVDQIRGHILSNESGLGALERYSTQITTDALNQFTAQYSASITDDLGLEWFEYVGSNLTTTRPWCEHMTRKRWIHRSELRAVIEDSIDGVRICSSEIPCNKKTGLPSGMIPGTNADNLKINRGGYNCGHQLIPVTANMVPEAIRMRIAA